MPKPITLNWWWTRWEVLEIFSALPREGRYQSKDLNWYKALKFGILSPVTFITHYLVPSHAIPWCPEYSIQDTGLQYTGEHWNWEHQRSNVSTVCESIPKWAKIKWGPGIISKGTSELPMGDWEWGEGSATFSKMQRLHVQYLSGTNLV